MHILIIYIYTHPISLCSFLLWSLFKRSSPFWIFTDLNLLIYTNSSITLMFFFCLIKVLWSYNFCHLLSLHVKFLRIYPIPWGPICLYKIICITWSELYVSSKLSIVHLNVATWGVKSTTSLIILLSLTLIRNITSYCSSQMCVFQNYECLLVISYESYYYSNYQNNFL